MIYNKKLTKFIPDTKMGSTLNSQLSQIDTSFNPYKTEPGEKNTNKFLSNIEMALLSPQPRLIRTKKNSVSNEKKGKVRPSIKYTLANTQTFRKSVNR